MSAPGGYTQQPNCVTFDTGLSFGARVSHNALMHLAWKKGRRENDDGVELPPLAELAALVGCSRARFHEFTMELKKAGLIATVRIRNQGQIYFIFDHSLDSDEIKSITKLVQPAGQAVPAGRTAPGSSLSIRGKTSKEDEGKPSSRGGLQNSRQLPENVKVDGQDLAFNALRDSCGIQPDSPRLPLVATALHGRNGKPGIRRLFWNEVVAWVDADPAREAYLLTVTPEGFQASLAKRIGERATKYQARFPDALMTPTALLSWWRDLDTTVGGRDQGMTSDEMRNYDRDSDPNYRKPLWRT